MGLFTDRPTHANGKTGVPVWFMRQAGRYHSHYQNIKKESDFMTMCKTPELACEITLGPIEDFKFDAAILFSDLLFPLEQMGLGLSYHSGPPTLEVHLKELAQVKALKLQAPATEFYQFQREACTLLRERLPQNITLLGFVGAPFTLYTYAVEGSHAGGLISSKQGLFDGRFNAFMELLLPELVENMSQQVQGGAQAVCLFDTAAGELAFGEYKEFIIPRIREVTSEFKRRHPTTPIIYYSKFTHLNYLHALDDQNIDVLGVDWRHDLREVLDQFGDRYRIQGNFDPSLLHLPWEHLQDRLRRFYDNVQKSKLSHDRWIMGLGHGVLQHTPEENVRKTVELIHREFIY
jgi:uroporphyrinogen decarboxylase